MESDFASSVGEAFSPGDVFHYIPDKEASLKDMLFFAPHRRMMVEEFITSNNSNDFIVQVLSTEQLGEKQPLEDIRKKLLLIIPLIVSQAIEDPIFSLAALVTWVREAYRRQIARDKELK
jgi:hypothetical protein